MSNMFILGVYMLHLELGVVYITRFIDGKTTNSILFYL